MEQSDRCYNCQTRTGHAPLSVTLRTSGRVFEFIFDRLACAMEFMRALEHAQPDCPPPIPPQRLRRQHTTI